MGGGEWGVRRALATGIPVGEEAGCDKRLGLRNM